MVIGIGFFRLFSMKSCKFCSGDLSHARMAPDTPKYLFLQNGACASKSSTANGPQKPHWMGVKNGKWSRSQ